MTRDRVTDARNAVRPFCRNGGPSVTCSVQPTGLSTPAGFRTVSRIQTARPLSSIRRFYLDTLTHDTTLLRAAIELVGPERVLLGSDYPFDMGLERPAEPVRELRLAPKDEEAILGGNALRLLGQPA